MQERFVDVEGGRLRYLASGEGELTLALWPGLGAAAEAFGRLLREGPARGHRVIALDPPGHGKSDPLPLRGANDAARLFEAVLEDAGAGPAVLGGHSYGAVAALAAVAVQGALRRPLRGLLLLDGGYLAMDEDEDPRESCARHIEAFSFASFQEFCAEIEREAGRFDADMEAAARAATLERDGRIRLRVSVETCEAAILFIRAHEPRRLPPLGPLPALLLRAGRPQEMEAERSAGVLALREKLASLAVKVLAEVSHELLDEDPVAAARETWEFLAAL